MRKTGHGINASWDNSGAYVIQVIYIFKGKHHEPSELYALALLNSALTHHLYYSLFGERNKSTFPHIRQQQFLQLPIRVIDFVHRTGEADKLRLLAQAGACIQEGEYETVLDRAHEALMAHARAHGPSGREELSEDPYWAEQTAQADADFPGREDFVHDLLAELAQRMMDLNKAKYDEIDRFVGWLEQELAVDVEDLSGKTFIKAYYEHDFDELVSRLNSNRSKLAMPVDGLFGAQLRQEYEASVETLRPLEDALEKTDRLIDQIVYRLYGLTDEEVAIVEESLE